MVEQSDTQPSLPDPGVRYYRTGLFESAHLRTDNRYTKGFSLPIDFGNVLSPEQLGSIFLKTVATCSMP